LSYKSKNSEFFVELPLAALFNTFSSEINHHCTDIEKSIEIFSVEFYAIFHHWFWRLFSFWN